MYLSYIWSKYSVDVLDPGDHGREGVEILHQHRVVHPGGVPSHLPGLGGVGELYLEEEGLLQLLRSPLPRRTQQHSYVYLNYLIFVIFVLKTNNVLNFTLNFWALLAC